MMDIVEWLRKEAELVALDRLNEAAAEIERLREQVATLQASSGYEASIAQVEIERLRAEIEAVRSYDLEPYAKEIERLRALLQEMPDLIKDIDGGNPETTTGWASEELLDLWMRVNAALEPKP